MDATRARRTLQRQLFQSWTELTASIAKMAAGCDIRPNAAAEVFEIIEGEDYAIRVVVKPVVFLLKEKAQADKSELYVTVEGQVNFSVGVGMAPPLACYFKTQVGYFRRASASAFDHVLGVHYDYDDKTPAHPVFHAQLTSQNGHLEMINKAYRLAFTLRKDLMKDVAKKVRLPTAHMDPLAVFVQLLADHLLNENSGSQEIGAFERARDALMFFKSDPTRSPRLDDVRAEQCFRGPRWYPSKLVAGAAAMA